MPDQIIQLQQQLDDFKAEYYRNNFSNSQDFPKYSRFKTRLKVPHYAANPTIGDVGDIVEVGGKLKICTVASLTAPTWVVVGTQT
jgi:hypothetical protein